MGNSENIEPGKNFVALEYEPIGRHTYDELETIIMRMQDAFSNMLSMTWPITEYHIWHPSKGSARKIGDPWSENDQFVNMTSEQGEAINELRDYGTGKHRDGTPATMEQVLGEFADILFSDVTLMQIFRVREGLTGEQYDKLIRKVVRLTMIKLWRRAKIVK